MANTKDTHGRVSAILKAGADKASHDTITTLQEALTADLAAWHERLAAIGNDNGRPGPERRHMLETGSVEDVMKLQLEAEQLQVWIERAKTQRDGLHKLDEAVDARESLANLPAHYQSIAAKLEAIGELNSTLLEAWQEVEDMTGNIEVQRRAVQRSGEAVPAPPAELAEALAAALNGARPMPLPVVFQYRENVATSLGLIAGDASVNGLSRVDVRVAA